MRKKKRFKQAAAGMTALMMGAAAVLSPMAGVPVMAAEVPVTAEGVSVMAAEEPKMTGEIAVDPDIHYQTLDGWGTSLCWWGNIIGSWGDADWNGNGRADREEIAELAFSPEYLNLNIVRYNVGGGDKADSSIKRCEGLVPGWTKDMTGTVDGSGEFDSEAFYGKTTEEMSDAGQLWMLEQANKYHYDYAQETGEENTIINKVFSNSPPYYMTKSGTSTGGYWNDSNNLKDDYYDDFAMYLARSANWVNQNLKSKFGVGVSYIEPLNEPDTNYWHEGSTKQEGCIFNTGELQSRAYREMLNAMEAEEFQGNLKDIKITGTDETSLWTAINSFNRLDDDIKKEMDTISAHTYSGSDSERKELRQIAEKYDKGLWMSEITRGGGSHYDGCHESMDAANTRSQSEGIMADLRYMQPTAWIAWLVADSEYECLQTNSNWGLIHAVFEKDGQPVPDYHTNLVDGNGNRKDWVPGEGYWAVTKQLYTMMQYSKYLKAGYTMIDIQDSNMCAAISPDGDELVIVAQNFEGERNTTVDLSAFKNAEAAELYRTSDSESCQLAETQDVVDGILDVTLPSNSVSTYIIRSNDGSAICSPDNYAKVIDANVEKPEEEWTSDLNKFTYTGSWGNSAADFGGGKYTTAPEASAEFTFEGTQAQIYGSQAPEGAVVNISVDGGEQQEVSLVSDFKEGGVLIYHTGMLEEGRHTITISKAADQDGKLLEISSGRIINGTLEEKIERIDKSEQVYTVSGVQPILPDTVTARTNMGNKMEKKVVWNLEGIDFTGNVTLEGTVLETAVKAAVDVQIAPENVQYFIDCNNPESPEYKRVNRYAELMNKTPDQKYEEGSWGYAEEYGKYDGDINDNYDTGWYADQGQEIRYTIPLEAGTYRVSMGFKEWWNQDRPMKVSVTAGDKTTELGTANTWKNNNPWNEEYYEFTCETAGAVTFSVAADKGPDPVLSFLRVQNKLNLQELKDALAGAAAIDRSQYTQEKLAVMDAAVKAGHPLLYRAETSQKDAEQAALQIRQAIEDLSGGGETQEADLTSLRLAVAMAEKLEKQQEENSCFTEESWAAVEEALVLAREVLEKPEVTQEEVDRAFLKLITRCNLLENDTQKIALKAVIDGAEAILADEESMAQYTEESAEAVRTALAEAKRVYTNDGVSQETVNEAARKLMDAVTGLLLKSEDTRLDILIQKAEAILKNEAQYTPSSIARLRTALESAKGIAENSQAGISEMNKAYQELAEAMTSLIRKGNKSELKNALDMADQILQNSKKYLESSISGLQGLTDEARKVYDDVESDAGRIGEVLKSLIHEILKARLMGDTDLNGVVDTNDSAELLKYNAELRPFTEEQEQLADVNGDGTADSGDAAVILQYAAEKIVSF